MSTIWKFPIEIMDRQVLSMPAGAKILMIQRQETDKTRGAPAAQLWAKVDPDRVSEDRIIHTFGTGHAIPDELVLDYIGTVMYHDGKLVFHYFEEL